MWSYLEWGGAQVYMMSIMKQAREDWDILVALPRGSSPDVLRFLEEIGVEYELTDILIDSAPAPTLKRKLERQRRRIKAELATLRFLKRFDLSRSVLHIEISPWQSWQFLTVLSRRGANVFITMHNAITGSPLREMIWKARLQFVSRLRGIHVFASNQDTKDRIKPFVSREFWKDVEVTYTAVDPVQIDRVLERGETQHDLRERHAIPGDRFVVLCVGQFVDRKGRWTFLDTAKLLENENVTFIWIAPALPQGADLECVVDYGLTNFEIRLSETLGDTREDVLSFFRVADCFALASFVEGLPIALLEAMALGVPSISTNVYAIPEAVKDRETGLLIEAGDAGALADAIIELKNNEELRKQLAANGREYVLAHFDEREAARRAIAKYQECFPDG